MPAKILIVDDSDQNRVLLRDVLRYNGYEVLTAADGAEGVHLAREHLPDLILMDIMMPGMNGIDAGKQLRGDPLTKEIRMLALSSFNLLDDDENFFATGFDGYIGKPIDLRQLPKTINQYLTGEEAS